MGLHATHNYSSSHIWLECDYWHGFKTKAYREGLPWDTTSAAAEAGTRKHKELEEALQAAFEDRPTAPLDLPVELALRGVMELLSRYPDASVATELAIPLPHEPDSDGYIDVAFWDADILGIVDAKFGKMEVDPSSPQLKGYAYALLCRLAELHGMDKLPQTVLLGIAQPEIRSGVLTIEYPTSEIIEFGREVQRTVERQLAGKNLKGPESLDTCAWCPAKIRCGYRTSMMAGMLEDFGKHTPVNSAALFEEPDLVERIVRSRQEIKEIIDECVAIVVANPDTFPDWKRTQVGNARKFDLELREPDEIAKLLEKAGVEWPWQLATPAQLKKEHPELGDAIDELTIDQGVHVRLSPLGSVARRRKAEEKPKAPAFVEQVQAAMRPAPAAPPAEEEKPKKTRAKTTKQKALEEIKGQTTKTKKTKK